MSDLLLLTPTLEPAPEILPSLGLLLHTVRVAPAEVPALSDAPPADAVLVDARRDLAQARSLCVLLRTAGLDAPVLAVLTEGGLAAVTAEWGADDVILHTAGPGRGGGPAAAGHRPQGQPGPGHPGRDPVRATWPSTRPPTRRGCAPAPST